jgi:hypothetical protein
LKFGSEQGEVYKDVNYFKRALVDVYVEDDGEKSSYKFILDYRSGMLTITR